MKGYVVRGKDGETDVWYESLDDGRDWDTTKRREDASTLTLPEAVDALERMSVPTSSPRILAVADDGTETVLPTYEEALVEIERLRGIIVEFTGEARLRADADGWCNLNAPLAAYEALCEERLSRIAGLKKGRETP